MMVSFAFNYNVTVPFIDSDATLCLITSIFIKGGAGEGGGAKIRIPVPMFSNGNQYIY